MQGVFDALRKDRNRPAPLLHVLLGCAFKTVTVVVSDEVLSCCCEGNTIGQGHFFIDGRGLKTVQGVELIAVLKTEGVLEGSVLERLFDLPTFLAKQNPFGGGEGGC